MKIEIVVGPNHTYSRIQTEYVWEEDDPVSALRQAVDELEKQIEEYEFCPAHRKKIYDT